MSEKEVRRALYSLMLAENLGDVHDEINALHKALGLPLPEGDFLEGFTDQDLKTVAPELWAEGSKYDD